MFRRSSSVYNMKRKLPYLFMIFTMWFFAWGVFKTEAEAPVLTAEQKYEYALDDYVARLAICESGQDPKQVTLNDGGSPSYGYVQFKLGTFWAYNQKFKVFPELTIDNLHHYVMQKDKQILMAKTIIKNEKGGYRNWFNCTVGKAHNKIGLPPTLMVD